MFFQRLMRISQQPGAGFLLPERMLFHPQQKRHRKIRADARKKVREIPFELQRGRQDDRALVFYERQHGHDKHCRRPDKHVSGRKRRCLRGSRYNIHSVHLAGTSKMEDAALYHTFSDS